MCQVLTGAVASVGGLGMIIPPSIVLIVYGILTEQSIGALFVTGTSQQYKSLLFCFIVIVYVSTSYFLSSCWLPIVDSVNLVNPVKRKYCECYLLAAEVRPKSPRMV